MTLAVWKRSKAKKEAIWTESVGSSKVTSFICQTLSQRVASTGNKNKTVSNHRDNAKWHTASSNLFLRLDWRWVLWARVVQCHRSTMCTVQWTEQAVKMHPWPNYGLESHTSGLKGCAMSTSRPVPQIYNVYRTMDTTHCQNAAVTKLRFRIRHLWTEEEGHEHGSSSATDLQCIKYNGQDTPSKCRHDQRFRIRHLWTEEEGHEHGSSSATDLQCIPYNGHDTLSKCSRNQIKV